MVPRAQAFPVGCREIATLTGIPVNTVTIWRKRKVMPVERWTVSGNPAWDWNLDILPWLKKTGRMPE